MQAHSEKDSAIRIIKILKQATKGMPEPATDQIIKEYGRDPFLILIACLLSLRARDTASLPVSRQLFVVADTPHKIMGLSLERLEKIIYSVGYYRSKAKQLKHVCSELIVRFKGKVPDTYEDLMSIKGIGPKTANLVLSEAFGKKALYVDIHVHRISNRLGLIKTKTPEQTQAALERIVPKEHWAEYSKLLVTWGQNVCVPISPLCSSCALYDVCKRVGVKRHR